MGVRTQDLPHVAIVGKMGAGKSTYADIFCSDHGYVKHTIASGVRDVAVSLWGEAARNDRTKLIAVGKSMREIDPDVWLNHFLRRVDAYVQTKVLNVVVDDVRFPNEYWALKERGFKFFYVSAPIEERVDRLLAIDKLDDRSQLEDETETALDEIFPQAADGRAGNSNAETENWRRGMVAEFLNAQAGRVAG